MAYEDLYKDFNVLSIVTPAMIADQVDYKGFYKFFSKIEKRGQDYIVFNFIEKHRQYKNNVKYYAALVLTLNHKIWEHYEKNNKNLARLYDGLWKRADNYAVEHFKGKDAKYYYDITD